MSASQSPDALTREDFAALQTLRESLASTRIRDRVRMARELDRLFARRVRDDIDSAVARLRDQIEKSCAQVEAVRAVPLRLEFPVDLPISAHTEEIATAMQRHNVVIVCGATGSGKTTQLPKICLQAGRGVFGLIGHTQPRRIAARALANRLAEEIQTSVGNAVGYQVRFSDRTGPQTRVKLMTDGILLKELSGDSELLRYDTLIIDEAHERTLNIDFLLGVLQRLVKRRSDLRVLVTSATIDPAKFSNFFGGAPVIEVSGRSYPVEVRYRSLYQRKSRRAADDDSDDEELEAAEISLPEGIVAAIQELDSGGSTARGDALIFLPGEKQINEAAEALSNARLRNTEILPLYSRLSASDQERIFQSHQSRRLVLATNVAETSLTVPGIRYVVDSGLARISRYSVRGKVQRLPIEPISKASADQRKGRCGRESEGICIRLYDEEDFDSREEFTPPEILRTSLASVILQMAVLRLGEPEDFPFPDPPDTRQLNDGYRLLQELQAVDDDRRVTNLGRQIAALPVDPRLARMLLAAVQQYCVNEMLIIASFLEAQDPRERPSIAQAEADRSHAEYADARSDFITVLNLWKLIADQQAAHSKSQFRKWCRERFLSFIRIREWQELRDQLEIAVRDLDLKVGAPSDDYARLHQAILTGFLGAIGELAEQREYVGARGVRFVIAPGTPLASRPPKWVVAGSLLDTTRLYARMVATIETPWIESAAAHLLKRNYSEPHWVSDRGFVAAFESISLYGLTIAARRRVNFGRVDPAEARRIFAGDALVARQTKWRAPFLDHNAKVRADVEKAEAKIRRRDLLVGESSLTDFYLQRLPADINSIAVLEKWLRDSKHDRALRMTHADVMTRALPEDMNSQFPDVLPIGPNRLALEYRFDTAADDDGITLIVPAPLLDSLDTGVIAWLVPGLRLEKVTALLRALPKSLRKAFVPVPDHAVQALDALNPQEDFFAGLARYISRTAGQPIKPEEIAALPLPHYLQFNIRVTDLEGRRLQEGRDLTQLKRALRPRAHEVVKRASANDPSKQQHRSWDFGELPEQREVERGGVRYVVFPSLSDDGSGVSIIDLGNAAQAERALRSGVLRLATLALPQQYKFVRSRFSQHNELTLLSRLIKTKHPLADELADRVFAECFFAQDVALPRSAAQFDAILQTQRSELDRRANDLLTLVVDMLQALRSVRQQLDKTQSPAFAATTQDVNAQLQSLLPEDFIQSTASPWFAQLPKYLKAAARRLERLPGNVARDTAVARQLAPFITARDQLHRIHPNTTAGPEQQLLRWMIEEFRVSLFAQDLRTLIPVSDRRLADQVERARSEARAA